MIPCRVLYRARPTIRPLFLLQTVVQNPPSTSSIFLFFHTYSHTSADEVPHDFLLFWN